MNFSYTAINKQGRLERGAIEAESRHAAIIELYGVGLTEVELTTVTKSSLITRLKMKALKSFLTTKSGYALRKLNELATLVAASYATYVFTLAERVGVSGPEVEQAATGGSQFIVAVIAIGGKMLIDLVLSKLADTANKEVEPPKAQVVE